MISRTRHFYCALMAVCRLVPAAVFVLGNVAHATSVVEVTLEEMLQNSAVVFEGQVVDVQVRENGNRVIWTQVTFEILEVIKGNVQGSRMTLGFLGGELSGIRLSVPAMQLPALNEHGIYFVESPARKQVQPLYGWSQGHLLLEKAADGTERVFTRSGKPVVGVEHTDGKRPGGLSKGVARGLVTGGPGEAAAALESSDFKRLLRAMR